MAVAAVAVTQEHHHRHQAVAAGDNQAAVQLVMLQATVQVAAALGTMETQVLVQVLQVL
jgi:hypothetical protein